MEHIEYISAEIPLTMEQVSYSFENPNAIFTIDYAESPFRGQKLLTYLSNLNLPVNISLVNTNVVEQKEFILTYLGSTTIVRCTNMSEIAAALLCEIKGIPLYYATGEIQVELQTLREIIRDNPIDILRWAMFMDSIPLFMMSTHLAFIEEHGQVRDEFPRVVDETAVGKNIVNLFRDPKFLELYSSVMAQQMLYFEIQFEKPIFAGKPLMWWFNNISNPLSVAMELITSKTDLNIVSLMQEALQLDEEVSNG